MLEGDTRGSSDSDRMRMDLVPMSARADGLMRSRASGRSSCVQCRARRVRGITASRPCVPIGSTINDPPHCGGRHRRASAEILSSTGKSVGADFVSCVAEAAQLRIFSAAAFVRSRYPCVARRHDWPCRRRAAPGQCRCSLCRKSLQRSVLSVQRSQKLTRCSGHESLCRSVSCAESPSRQPGANRKPSLQPTRRKIASQRSRLQHTVRACSPFVPYARRSLGAKMMTSLWAADGDIHAVAGRPVVLIEWEHPSMAGGSNPAAR